MVDIAIEPKYLVLLESLEYLHPLQDKVTMMLHTLRPLHLRDKNQSSYTNEWKKKKKKKQTKQNKNKNGEVMHKN